MRETWLKAYRLARQPDMFYADDTILDFPVRYLLYAIQILETRGNV